MASAYSGMNALFMTTGLPARSFAFISIIVSGLSNSRGLRNDVIESPALGMVKALLPSEIDAMVVIDNIVITEISLGSSRKYVSIFTSFMLLATNDSPG